MAEASALALRAETVPAPTGDPLAGLVRQRLDFRDNADGSITTTLTISLPNGVVKRFEDVTWPHEVEAVAGEHIGGELAILGPDGEIGISFFKRLGRVAKGVGKIAKDIASSKIMKIAAAGLALAAPLLGPIAPVALAASAGLGVAAKLAKAGVAAAQGATNVAKQITASAALDARRLTKTPEGAASLLQAANNKRLAASAIAAKPSTVRRPTPRLAASNPRGTTLARRPAAAVARPTAAKASTSTKITYPPLSEADLLARARSGRVRSSRGENVTEPQLLAAYKTGRIYWVL